MLSDNQWQQDMIDGIYAAYVAKKCGCSGAGLLRESVKELIDHQRMNHDTCQRTGGKCPTQRGCVQRQYTRLTEAFEKLTRIRR